MDWDFDNKDLTKLYETGKSRKYKGLSSSIIEKFVARVGQIESAQTIYDFWQTPSLKFEKMQGRTNQYSIRVDKKWHLELEINWDDEKKTKGAVLIKELSNHYGD